jgi:hypothetical protein
MHDDNERLIMYQVEVLGGVDQGISKSSQSVLDATNAADGRRKMQLCSLLLAIAREQRREVADGAVHGAEWD